ncbi:MAG: lipase [Gammaproteobacteria bacterium]|nr:lipase [Gammaproteobacteria bacterium]MBU2425536.1 lipase [Gammaproteobacteria bacterium]
MNKLLVSLAVASALGLAGCGDSLNDLKNDAVSNDTVLVPMSRVVFDPTAGIVSVPNDLLFQGTTDGTLVLPGEAAAVPNYADPQTALGALDGWSTQNPFAIELAFAGGVSLDAASASRPDSVRIVEVLMGDPSSPDAACKAVPRGVACKAVGQLTFGQDFVTKASGNSVAVIPLKPLKAATTYIVVLTNNLKDSEGRSIAPSTTYELVKQDLATLPLGSDAQRALQGVINSFENAVSTQSIAKDTIIYTAAVTTQSTTNVLSTVKQLMLPSALNNNTPPSIAVSDSGLLVSDVLFPGKVLTPADPEFAFKTAKLYTGSINLPYYLGTSTAEAPNAALSTRWVGRCDSGAMIAGLSTAQVTALEAGITSPAQMQNNAVCKALSGGALRDYGIDKQRHLTKFNVVPKTNSVKTLAVQMTVPNEALGLVKPAEGWPVVILQHGITSCKENMLAVTGALSSQGFATIAIDHPLHGSRGFDVDGDGKDEINASGGSCFKNGKPIAGNATVYMNLADLLVTRDNLRQSVADMLGLRLGMNFNNVPGLLNTQNVQLLGHSLGAITGTTMVGLANSTTGSAAGDALYKIKSTSLAMPGGAVANFLLESPSFGGLIKANVMLGSSALSAGFKTFVDSKQVCVTPASYVACASTFTDAYLADLTAKGQVATLATISATLSQFAFAAQTVTDAGDPNNYAAALVASNTPVHVMEVVGNGSTNKSDQVIPNQAVNMPLAGTEPLARLLGVSSIPAKAGSYAISRAAITRFTEGEHSSILSPAVSAAATTEMQRQTVTFFLSGGTGLTVFNPAVIKP